MNVKREAIGGPNRLRTSVNYWMRPVVSERPGGGASRLGQAVAHGAGWHLGGRLKTAGRFLQFPGYSKAGHRTIANFFQALLHAVGDKRKTCGEPDQELRDVDTPGPLAERLASEPAGRR